MTYDDLPKDCKGQGHCGMDSWIAASLLDEDDPRLADDELWFSRAPGYKLERIPKLLPYEKPLAFREDYVQEVMHNPAYDCMGIYVMGWEL